MKSAALVCSRAHAGFFVLTLVITVALGIAQAQNEPILVPDAVDYQKLLPILPEPPQGWTADKPEGSTEDVGGFRITNVHRDYHKGEGEKTLSGRRDLRTSRVNVDDDNRQRSNGPTGDVTLTFLREFTKFVPYSPMMAGETEPDF